MLPQDLASAEASLESLLDSVKGEMEGYHKQLSQVRTYVRY